MREAEYEVAAAAGTDVTLLKLQPYTGNVLVQPVLMGAVHKPITCAVFSADGAWLHAGSTSGEIITVNAVRSAVQLTHTIMHGGVLALERLHGQV